MFRNRINFLALVPVFFIGLTLGLIALAAEITFWTVGYMYEVYRHLRGYHGES